MSFGRKAHTKRKVAIGSAIAGVAGYIAGVLTAPQSGRATRRDVADKAEYVKDSTEDQLSQANDELKEMIKTAKQKTAAMSSSARVEFNEAVIKAKDAQNKSAEILKALRQGEAGDPELNKAVKQARQAAKNLGKYLKS